MNLNSKQQEAADHDKGPLLLLAGAGTGKTHTLCSRVAQLIKQGVESHKILMLTFTRKAADEMKQRIENILDKNCFVMNGTFHSIAFNDLKNLGILNNLSGIFDDASQAKFIRKELKKKNFENISSYSPREFMRFFSLCTNTMEDELKIIATHFPNWLSHSESVLKLKDSYTRHKNKLKAYDYDDILCTWLDALQGHKTSLSQQCEYILVDEYQDTSKLQIEILKKLCKNHSNIMAVGDDCQSIYSFRGALPEQISQFSNDFPGAKSLTLEENYRSTKQILDFANKSMIDAKGIIQKKLHSAIDSQGENPDLFFSSYHNSSEKEICREIYLQRSMGVRFDQQAILYRSTLHCLRLEMELTRQGIPYKKFGSKKITDKSHIKKFAALLSFTFSEKVHKLALMQCLEIIPGLGPKTVEKTLLQIDDGKTLKDIKFPTKSIDSIQELLSFQNMAINKNNLEELIRFAEPLIFNSKEDNRKKLKDIFTISEELRKAQNWDDFYTDIILNMEVDKSDDGEALTLSTIHSAKGKEWQNVHILAVNEGAIPLQNSQNIEEERRLLYVAITRAKKRLKLYIENTKELRETSRFLHKLRENQNSLANMDKFETITIQPQNKNYTEELCYVSEDSPGTALAQSDMDELTYVPFYD
ncbi:ATP-dependent helicase [Lentisphaera marina]|uniref:ATP-dependent helicase n=1 Tax=Lentisphaera marina TaxID=1111041 RepID=UPI00236504F0|nr:ATP-dependent helicase [Lentisphaera marina]MDD7986458.1 ATP-dependent helicase [Lentisphaera marina]